MNITPNSFSDGNNLNSYPKVKSRFTQLVSQFDIIDIGAESTAPFNDAIDSVNELERFEEYFFNLLVDIPDPSITLSIDTYRPEVFYEIALVVMRFWPKTKLIFNDVSGKIDSELLDLFKESIEFDYVLCHNLCPKRDDTQNHMNYISDDVIKSVSIFFEEGQLLLNSNRQIYADPCFGFSKTLNQNLELLESLNSIESLDPYAGTLVGISRKSFLRGGLSIKDGPGLSTAECVHSIYLNKLIRGHYNNLIIRSHELFPIHAALKAIR